MTYTRQMMLEQQHRYPNDPTYACRPGPGPSFPQSFRFRRATKMERKERREAMRTMEPDGNGYCCPKCHARFDSSEARSSCRRNHPVAIGVRVRGSK